MMNLEQILTGQQAHFEFRNNKVIYSSISTQGNADTMEEAINAIVAAVQNHDEKVTYRIVDSKELDELENKQVPKKPIYSEFDEDDDGENLIPYKAVCPVCSYEFEFGTWNDEENHHCICGQAMNWER